MSSTVEQWSLIFCVIIPSMQYLMLITLDRIDENRQLIRR
jgi:hypothetical protein